MPMKRHGLMTDGQVRQPPPDEAEQPLPTADCTPELHAEYHGACYHCCDRCNYDTHRCHFCGDDLRHDERQYDGKPHPCYDPTCPECVQGKHENCTGFAFNAADEEVSCSCDEHPKETL